MNYSFMGPSDPSAISFSDHEQKPEQKKVSIIHAKNNSSVNPGENNPFLDATGEKKAIEKSEPTIDIEQYIREKRPEKILASPDVVLSKKKIRKNNIEKKGILDKLSGGITARGNEMKDTDENNFKPIALTSRGEHTGSQDVIKNISDPIDKLKQESEIKESTLYNSPRSQGLCCTKVESCQCSIF